MRETYEQALERYRRQRREAIAALEVALGRDACVPLDAVATLLPEHPEWTYGVPRARA